MALDFPASPTLNQLYPSPAVPGVPVYTWDGEKWTTRGGAIGSTGAADDPPPMNGTANVGVSTQWAREDHIHPTDTTRTSATDVTNIVKAYAAPFDAMAYNGMQINGGMDVNQESIVSYSGTSGYVVDCWLWVKSSTATCNVIPTNDPSLFKGFENYITVNITGAGPATPAAADYVFLRQPIEGWRTARLAWGTANASPITIAFWSGHQVAGVYPFAIQNSANNRSYSSYYSHVTGAVAQYNIITIPGDTTGTWNKTNGTGIFVFFPLSIGSQFHTPAGANAWAAGNYFAPAGTFNATASTTNTFRLGGVTVLPGTQAPTAAQSPNIMRPYDQELLTCQRYYETIRFGSGISILNSGLLTGTNNSAYWPFHIIKRATPTVGQGAGTTWQGSTPNTTSISVNGTTFSSSVGYFYLQGTAGGIGLIADARL